MARLEIGYLLPTRDQAVLGKHELGRLVSQARRAEELGLNSVWAGDSPVTRPRADGWLPYPPTATMYAQEHQAIEAATPRRPVVASIQATFAGTPRQAADWLHGYAVLPLLRKEDHR
jgi:hypothetical protein